MREGPPMHFVPAYSGTMWRCSCGEVITMLAAVNPGEVFTCPSPWHWNVDRVLRVHVKSLVVREAVVRWFQKRSWWWAGSVYENDGERMVFRKRCVLDKLR